MMARANNEPIEWVADWIGYEVGERKFICISERADAQCQLPFAKRFTISLAVLQ